MSKKTVFTFYRYQDLSSPNMGKEKVGVEGHEPMPLHVCPQSKVGVVIGRVKYIHPLPNHHMARKEKVKSKACPAPRAPRLACMPSPRRKTKARPSSPCNRMPPLCRGRGSASKYSKSPAFRG